MERFCRDDNPHVNASEKHPVQKNRRGPGKYNIASVHACRLADLVQGTADNWATSPKQIVEGIGAPVSHEYLRRAMNLHPEARRKVEMGWFPLVSVNTFHRDRAHDHGHGGDPA